MNQKSSTSSGKSHHAALCTMLAGSAIYARIGAQDTERKVIQPYRHSMV